MAPDAPAKPSSSLGPVAVLLGVLALVLCAGCGVFGAGFFALVYMAEPPHEELVGGPIAIVTATTYDLATASPRRVDGLFAYSTARTADEPILAHLRAPVPVAETDEWYAFENGEFAYRSTYAFVAARACAGDAAMNDDILRAVRASDAAGVTPDAIEYSYEPIYDECDAGSAVCPWLVKVVTSGEKPAVKAPFWNALGSLCDGADVEKAMETGGSPTFAYRTWLDRRIERGAPIGWSKRLESAIAEEIRDGEDYTAYDSALILGSIDDPRVARSLTAIHAAETNSEKRDSLALAMFKQKDPAAAALYRAACKQNSSCGRDLSVLIDLTKDPADTFIGTDAIDLREVVDASPNAKRRKEVLDAIADCAENDVDFTAAACLDALAAYDWSRARELAGNHDKDDFTGASVEVADTLGPFRGGASELTARLERDGLLTKEEMSGAGPSVRRMLKRAKRTAEVQLDEGGLAEHDALLYRLAALAHPDLDGIAFVQTTPDSPGDAYRFAAYLGGRSWTVDAAPTGTSYDIDTCLGLLNTILADRGSKRRLARLTPPYEDAPDVTVIVAGPAEALSRASSEGWLTFQAPGAAR